MKTIEEKRELFLDMQEHPEKYSEQELQAMLDDPEMADDIKAFEMLREAYALRSEELDASLSEECGVRSEELYASPINSSKCNNSSLLTPHSFLKNTPHSSLFKVAAMFVGCLLVAGIAYAAIRMATERTPMPISEAETTESVSKSVPTVDKEEKESVVATDSVVRFEEAELQTIVNTMADHYGVKARFDNDDARHIRLFLVWNKQQSLDEVVKILNGYDRINAEIADNTLTIK